MELNLNNPIPLSAAAHAVRLSRAAARRLAALVAVQPRVLTGKSTKQ
jgi:hypothetical protein